MLRVMEDLAAQGWLGEHPSGSLIGGTLTTQYLVPRPLALRARGIPVAS